MGERKERRKREGDVSSLCVERESGDKTPLDGAWGVARSQGSFIVKREGRKGKSSKAFRRDTEKIVRQNLMKKS